jgi:hypothetical protein
VTELREPRLPAERAGRSRDDGRTVTGRAAASFARSLSAARAGPRAGWTRVGTVQLSSAVRYLAVWAAVMCGVLLLVLVGGYIVLAVLGVTGSASRALAIILDEPLPSSGVLPLLQPSNVLPVAVLVSVLLSALCFASALAAVLVHNAVTELTGGLRVRLRSGPSGPPLPRPFTAREEGERSAAL